MKYRGFLCTSVILFSLLFITYDVNAVSQQQNTLIVYSSTEQNPPLVEQIAAMVSPYTKSKVRSYEELKESDLVGVKSLIYIGMKKENIDMVTKSNLKEAKQWIIGENIEQFEGFESVKRSKENQIAKVNGVSFEQSFQIQNVQNINAKSVITEKSQGNGQTIIWGKGNQYYLPTTSISQSLQWAIQPKIVGFFNWQTNHSKKAAIVIDQITPNTKVEKLNRITSVLNDAKIPIVLAIQPLGQGDQENRLTTFDENKKLRSKIKSLQKEGAMIILSGFKPVVEKQSLLQAEFWQIEEDQPMREAMESVNIATIKRSDFPSEVAYEEKRHAIGIEEQRLTKESWNEAIDESVNAGMIPTGMTIENDAASKYVYKELSKMTSTFIGNIQFGDSFKNRVLQPTIYQSDLLNNVTVFPINLQPNNTLDEQLKQLQMIEGAFAGIKIHVDDSIEQLNTSIQLIEEDSSFQWITTEDLIGEVQSDLVHIQPTQNGDIQVEKPNKLFFQMKMLYKNNLFELILWILFVLVLLFVLLFFINVLRLRISLKKRLFEERKPNG